MNAHPPVCRRADSSLRSLLRAHALALAVLSCAPGLWAQAIALDTFDATGATGAILTAPATSWIGNVTRNATSITVGGTAKDDNGWGASGQNINATGMNYVSVIAQRDPGNFAPSLVVQLVDSLLVSHTLSIDTSQFAVGTLTRVDIPIGTWPTAFNRTQIARWSIGGGTPPLGLATFRMTLYHLALVAAPSTSLSLPPVISSATTATAVVGSAFSYTITASDSPTSFTATNLPDGLSPPNSSGVISGTPTTAGTSQISLTATNANGTGPAVTLSLTVSASAALGFPTQPAAATVAAGATATFAVAVAGIPTPTIKWQRSTDGGGNWTDLSNDSTYSGTTSTALTVSAVTLAMNGHRFRVLATNGTPPDVTSNAAILTVTQPPIITQQPVAQAVNLGANVTFTAAASGNPAPAFQWRLNGADIGGATSPTLSIANVQPIHEGDYTVFVSNSLGNATSTPAATLSINAAPVFGTQPIPLTLPEGQTATFTAAATGKPSPTYQWQKGGVDLPGETNATLTLTNLQRTASGTYRVLARNSVVPAGVASSAVSLDVQFAPTITTPPASLTVIQGQPANFTVAFTANPAPTSFQWRQDGVNLGGATAGTYSIPSAQPANAGGYTVVITNGVGTPATSTPAATLTVNPVAPVLTSSATVSGVIGADFRFQLMANTSQATFSVASGALPAGLSLNSATGLITGIPTALGTTSLTVTASNTSGNDTKPLAITVSPPPPVIVTTTAPNGQVGTSYLAFTVNATNTPTAFTATGLPPGLSINNSGVISGDPTQAGTFTASVTATNATGSNTSSVVIVINQPPSLPAFTGGTNLSGVQGGSFNFAPAFLNGPFTNFSATGLPAGLAINATTGVITAGGSGITAAPGSYVASITVSNAGGPATFAFTFTINPAPTAPVITGASNAAGTVNSFFTLTLTSSGTPPASSYSAIGLPGTLTLDPASGTIAGTPLVPATLSLQVSATNSAGTGPQRTLVIVINPSASAPVITSAPVIQGRVGDAFSGVAITASNSPANFVITSGTLPAGLQFDAGTGAITGTPTQVGERRVVFAASNVAGGQGLGVEILFNIAPALTMPVVTSNATAAGQVTRPFQYVITATNAPTSFAATGLPSWLSLAATTGVLSGFPSGATPTPIEIILTATNGAGTGSPKTLLLSISPPPGTPQITSSLAAFGQQGVAFNYQISASESPTSFVALNLPAGLGIDFGAGAISGTPTVSGTFNVTLRAGNAAGQGASSTLVLNLAAGAQAPTITSAPSAAGKVGVDFRYATTVLVTVPVTVVNAFSLTGTLPLGLSLNTSTGVLSGQPAESGVFTVQLTASGPGGTSLPQTLVLSIDPPDGVPVITSPTIANSTVGANFSYPITAVIMPGGGVFPAAPFPATHSLDAVGLPAGLAVNPATGLIQGRPAVSGTFTVTLVGTNAIGRGPFRGLTLTIAPAPAAPVITGALSVVAQAGTAFSYQITADNNPTAYEVAGAPAWMSVNTQNGIITGSPAAPGSLLLLLRASNSAGASAPATLTLNIIPAANTPVISSAHVASGQVRSALPFAYQATASVPTGAPAVTSYFVSGLPAGLTFNGATGAIGGTPAESGVFTVTLSASNANGQGAPISVVITITPSVQLVAPRI